MNTTFYNKAEVNNSLSQEFLDGEWSNYAGKPLNEEASAEWKAGWDLAQAAREEWEAVCSAAGDGFVLE